LKTARQLQKSAEELGRNEVVIETLVLQGLASRYQTNDEGSPMAQLLYEAANRGIRKEYTGRILSNFPLHREAGSAE
jgi:hypothetical protein